MIKATYGAAIAGEHCIDRLQVLFNYQGKSIDGDKFDRVLKDHMDEFKKSTTSFSNVTIVKQL